MMTVAKVHPETQTESAESFDKLPKRGMQRLPFDPEERRVSADGLAWLAAVSESRTAREIARQSEISFWRVERLCRFLVLPGFAIPQGHRLGEIHRSSEDIARMIDEKRSACERAETNRTIQKAVRVLREAGFVGHISCSRRARGSRIERGGALIFLLPDPSDSQIDTSVGESKTNRPARHRQELKSESYRRETTTLPARNRQQTGARSTALITRSNNQKEITREGSSEKIRSENKTPRSSTRKKNSLESEKIASKLIKLFEAGLSEDYADIPTRKESLSRVSRTIEKLLRDGVSHSQLKERLIGAFMREKIGKSGGRDLVDVLSCPWSHEYEQVVNADVDEANRVWRRLNSSVCGQRKHHDEARWKVAPRTYEKDCDPARIFIERECGQCHYIRTEEKNHPCFDETVHARVHASMSPVEEGGVRCDVCTQWKASAHE